MRPDKPPIGLICFGHANAGFAVYLQSRGIPFIVWALDDHPGGLRLVEKGNGRLHATGYLNGMVNIQRAPSLKELLSATDILCLTTRTDAQDRYVEEFEKYNNLLEGKTLLVFSSNGFAIAYHRRLRFKHIVEADIAPVCAKLLEQCCNLKQIKRNISVSCYPMCKNSLGEPILPAQIKQTLTEVLSEGGIQFRVLSPLGVIFRHTNGIVHGITAVTSMSMLPDDDKEITEKAKAMRKLLDARYPPGDSKPFFGGLMTTPVCNVHNAAHQELQALARECGIELDDLIDIQNRYYGTDFENCREYYLKLDPLNVQKNVPVDMSHRHYAEEYVLMTLWISIADIVGKGVDIIRSAACLSQAGRPQKYQTCGRDLNKLGFTRREDLIGFGAQF
ncbi:hypothetical protein HFN63_33120 [Rhizobium leguminosarum]|uniref:NAD/NADP octopine/nopaline dehydrogenase family protein n=1 Tax=Rhizobium leguminosarum TaxID=384 RepID=UPI001C972783|nr:NAD/NADP octopine/nopaline dehydrogenase family protein [Rhizobium leguminosarum]MBY5774870.1 hypothetical protein [Rhizobium leguminosarum]